MRAALNINAKPPVGGQIKWPDWAKMKQMGVERMGFPTTDPRIPFKDANGSFLEQVRSKGVTLFAFRALWGWSGSPEGWADQFRTELGQMDMLKTGQHGARQCALNADLEVDDSAWMMACLARILQVLPGRGLTWSLQPHKGGVISDKLVNFINAQRWLTICPFNYYNDMRPVSERWVVEDLLARGIRNDKILIYYGRYCEAYGILYDLDTIA